MTEQLNYPISKILAEEIKDSRGNPTIKVTVWVGASSGSFSVPSGASTGAHEAHELRDPDGRGVKNAIEKVNNVIAPVLIGKDVSKQKEIDETMIKLDGTANKDNLGGNSMIGVSIACAKAAAKVSGKETFEYLRTLAEILPRSEREKPSRKVPYLFMNMLEGGKHVHNGFGLAFQEYLIVPETEDVTEAINIEIKMINTLKEIIGELDNGIIDFGDEGGLAPRTGDVRVPLKCLDEAIRKNNLQNKIHLALDIAASSFYKNGKYEVDKKNILKEELLNVYNSLAQEFNLFSIEDAFDEEDFESFAKLKKENTHATVGQADLLVVGDDLTVSNSILLKKAIEKESINTMIIKPNQIGTLTETLETMKLARENGIELIVSHRSGETDDDFIADLAYAFGCFGLKAGSPTKPERRVKYDRLVKISGE
jgi:enolase